MTDLGYIGAAFTITLTICGFVYKSFTAKREFERRITKCEADITEIRRDSSVFRTSIAVFTERIETIIKTIGKLESMPNRDELKTCMVELLREKLPQKK